MAFQHLHRPILAALLLLLSVTSLTCANGVDEISHHPSQFLEHLVGRQRGDTVKGVHKLKQYLQKFGYVIYPNSTVSLTSISDDIDSFDDVLECGIRTYQKNYHLKVTGTLDAETVQQMMKPRCGVPDIVNGTNFMAPRKKHRSRPLGSHKFFGYQLQPGMPRWPPSKTHLSYAFLNNAEAIRSGTARAFQKWSDVTQFTFEEVQDSNGADITIGAFAGSHGDGNNFDGPGGTLAHSTGPTVGMFHLDVEEDWSITSPGPSQIDFESVAVHEIGHLLGLGHSSDPNAIMYPSIEYGVTKRELQRDDIDGIHALYNN